MSILSRIRSYFEPEEAKTVVRNPSTDGKWVELGRYEPVIPEKHFGYGWNTVAVSLEAGGECRVYVGKPPYHTGAEERQNNE